MNRFRLPESLLLLLFSAHGLAHAPDAAGALEELPWRRNVRVAHVWAVWCTPCRQELPRLSRWHARHKEIDFYAIGLDEPAVIRQFVHQKPMTFALWRHQGGDAMAWLHALGDASGGVPFTLMQARACGWEKRWTGQVSPAMLDAALKKMQAQCHKTRAMNHPVS